jgi:hypothetical protein
MPGDRLAAGSYEQDFDVWPMSRAAALRAAGASLGEDQPGTQCRTPDWENLAAEIEGKRRRVPSPHCNGTLGYRASPRRNPGAKPHR